MIVDIKFNKHGGIAVLKHIDDILYNNKTVTITFVGDSITYGMDYCRADETFVAVFTNLIAKKYSGAGVYRYDGKPKDEKSALLGYNEVLVQDGKEGRINVIRSGVGGNTVARALNRFHDYTGVLPSGTRSDFIITMFGINDALSPDSDKYVTADVFKDNYRKLINDLKNSEPQAEIILMTATTSPFSIAEYNKKTEELAKEYNLNLIDLYSLWNERYSEDAENFGYGDWLSGAGDPWHPTATGAYAMGEKIFYDFFKCFKG